jgi:hypothetical protein
MPLLLENPSFQILSQYPSHWHPDCPSATILPAAASHHVRQIIKVTPPGKT